jgi:hypothetical protein
MAIDRSTIKDVSPRFDREHWAILRGDKKGPRTIVAIVYDERSFTDPQVYEDIRATCDQDEYPVFTGSAQLAVGWVLPIGCHNPDDWVEERLPEVQHRGHTHAQHVGHNPDHATLGAARRSRDRP